MVARRNCNAVRCAPAPDVLRPLAALAGSLLAAIHDPESVRRVLVAMGLSPEVPVLAVARGPPEQRELSWE